MKTSYSEIQPYVTKDGSLIRELMHPDFHGNRDLSFAQAIIEPGGETKLHAHNISEEIYHIVQGTGIMTLGRDRFPVVPGDTICILPGLPHKMENTGREPLIILCCCTPPYSHADTEIGVERV